MNPRKLDEGVWETASETPVRKPGRPPLPAGLLEIARQQAPWVTTRRGLMNVLYRIIGLTALGDDPRYDWLRSRATVLTELGRYGLGTHGGLKGDLLLVRQVAESLLKTPLPTREALGILRHARRGKDNRGRDDSLARRILSAIRAYLEENRDMRREDVQTALTIASRVVNELGMGK